MSILENIQGHEDLQLLNDEQRNALCQELREELVSNVSQTGGHLASNLGVVELTVALETVFDTQKDRLVFDVGHQSYVHKMLTGRQAAFGGLRQFGGIAGFPKPSESDTDAFGAGHASSSISIALGMARARSLLKENYNVIALLGDGAATGGMVYEGLNDVSDSKEPMIIVLNDNEMSIDKNVGGMSKHLTRLRTKERYLGMKSNYRRTLMRIPGGRTFFRATKRIKDWVKRALMPTTIFENMGLTYLGPVDGHDLPELIRVLKVAKMMKFPVLLHVVTQKGCGYTHAEEKPSKFHGIGRFDPASGEVVKNAGYTFSDAFGDTLCRLAGQNDRICAITAAMPGGTGLLKFRDQCPDRLFDVGIAEEHAVSMAGGLAKQGMVPVVALYSTFLQRAYDQLIQDVAMLNLHVVFAIDRAGLVGEDGETHHGVFDVGFLRQIPNMTVLCPASTNELASMLIWAVRECNGPVAIRYPRGGDVDIAITDADFCPEDTVCCQKQGSDVCLITYGVNTVDALRSAEMLGGQGISASVLRLQSVKPLPVDAIVAHLGSVRKVLILEETCRNCGIHEALTYALQERLPNVQVQAMDLGDGFVMHGSVAQLRGHYGIDSHSITKRVKEAFGHEN